MAYQLTPFMILYVFIFALTLSLALYASLRYARYDRRLSVLAFTVLMFSVAYWELTSIILEMVVSQELKLITLNISNATSVPFYNFSLLLFSLSFSDSKKWIKWPVVAFAINVAGLGVLLFFNPEFLYESQGVVTRGPVTILVFTFEEYVLLARDLKLSFTLYGIYSYLVALGSASILIRYISVNADDLRTAQSVLIGVGIGTPVVLNGIELFGVTPLAVSVTEIGFGVTAICFALAIFKYQLFEIPPINRQQLVDLIDDPVVFINDDRVVYSNQTARQVFDVGSNWREMDVSDFLAPHSECSQLTSADGATRNSTLELDDADQYFDVKRTRVRTPGAKTGGRVVVLREITELKQTNRRLDQFAAMVSHDLRTPLNHATNQINRLEGGRSDDSIEAVRESLEQMETITDGMLTLARAGEDVDTTDECSVAELAEEVWETLQTDGAALDSRAGDTTIEADQVRLFQLFENLFRNAIEHNEPPLTVRVGTLPESDGLVDGPTRVGFFIEDDGSGIPENDWDAIFEHGYTTNDDGTGYGLSVVRQIVDAHGWEIQVTDGTDGGARFEIHGVRSG